MTSPSRMLRLAAFLVFALALVGCEDAVDPTLGTDQAFSLYGYLDPTADRQAIRVVPITQTIAPDSISVAGVTVTATEPATGRSATFRDSAITFADGSTGFVFLADYTPTPGARVELAVLSPDGGTAAASVEIPPLVRPEVGAPTPEQSGAVYPVTVRDVPRVIGGTLRVFVTNLPGTSGTTALDIPIGRVRIQQDGAAWTVRVPFQGAVREYLQERDLFNAGVVLVEAEFRPFVANAEWAVPDGGFDLDQIAEPGTFSNVDGGFGFVGAGYPSPVRWVPSTNVQSLSGFSVVNDPGAQVAINEIGDGYIELYNPTTEPIDLTGYLVTVGTVAEGIRIPAPGVIQPEGRLTVSGPFQAAASTTVQFLTGSGRLLSTAFVETTVAAWGAFPDGFSYQIPRGGPNLFYGPVEPSPGASNRPAYVPAVINEIYATGEGFVEIYDVSLEFEELSVASSPDGLANGPVRPSGLRPFLTAPERLGLSLDLIGGAVFLMADSQVIDVRFFGAQTPERSAGYLPDGPSGTWTTDLLPTRGAPNALARLGL